MRSVIWFYLSWILIISGFIYFSFYNKSKEIKPIPLNIETELDDTISIEYQKIFPILVPKKSYISKGEKFEADVFLVDILKDSNKVSSVSINGQRVKINKNGIGKFSEIARIYGPKRLNLNTGTCCPLTG